MEAKKYKNQMFLRGLKKGIPVLIGFIPISLAFSVIAVQTGLTKAECIIMSIMLLAGASQLTAVNMLAVGAGSVEIIIATLIINIRHLIMSTYVMNRLEKVPKWMKWILAFGVTDETFGIISMEEDEYCNQYFFGGLALITYGSWIGGTVLGTIIIDIIPTSICSSMSIALYAMFIGLLTPSIHKNHKVLKVVLVSMFINYILGMWIKSSWAIVAATLLGGIIGARILEEKEAQP
ncbi:AzlC family ABC transporter permease [Cellulosilyticum ruminicola]|uniref:AzlC family ABC transporter permease n=1 Tax=Cellulosilyticum ruminicola TaxID=425254 RepID=UPI0006D12B15|nr:AzlC family ABC transporter permease [Cellulosilyticum ruminicola]